jgi:hypothetical protein
MQHAVGKLLLLGKILPMGTKRGGFFAVKQKMPS